MFNRKILMVGFVLLIFIVGITTVAAINKEEYNPLDYKQLDKNSNKFLGQKFYATGEVFQIMESGDTGFMLLSVDGDSSQNIAVFYKGTNDVVEGDSVTVYGTVSTDYSYESTAGYKLTVPCVLSDEIVKN